MMRVPGLFVMAMLVVISLSSPIAISPLQPEIARTIVVAQTGTPSARFLPGMVYDPLNERVMLFGGGLGDTELDDTWVLDYEAKIWTELTLSNSPTPRSGHVMVFDSNNGVIILFGGYNGTSPARDTWAFNCTSETWTEVTPETSPPERMSHAMVYDSLNGKVVLFSGYGPDGPEVDDTWAYDYATNTWEEMNPAVSPHARYGAAHVFDEANETMIIFGGNSHGYFSDTWSYDYSTDTWTDLVPSTHPIPLKWSGMTYDSANQKSILYGGDINHPIVSNETWIFDSTANEWEESETAVAPSSRQTFGFAFDPINEKAILFGGSEGTGQPSDSFNETWIYDYMTDSWTKMEPAQIGGPVPLDPILILSVIVLVVVLIVVVAGAARRKGG